MKNKNKRRLSVILFSLLSFSLYAQDINDIGVSKVNQMKKDGMLTGKEHFTNRAVTPNSIRYSSGGTNTPNASTSCNCWIPRDTSFHIVPFNGSGGSGGPGVAPDYRNDDWSTVPITLPFNVCFYGDTINQVYINNNGNVSIGGAYSTFTALSFPDSTYTMIAPFWADVDTRGALSGLVYYSITPTHMIVQWDHVGYYGMHDDLLNTFQLIITDGTDPIINPGQNVSFCYKDMQWTTGDASQGQNGFGGVPATVGINQGNGVDYIQFGLFDHVGNSYDGPYGLNDGVDWLDNQSFTINSCINTSNIPPVLNSLNVCDTIRLCENTTYTLTANYLSPEQGQSTIINFFAFGMAGVSVVSNTPGNTAELVLQIIGQTANLGYHTISVTAIDNGSPAPAATTNNFVIEVLPAPLPSFTYSPSSPVLANNPITFTNTTPPGALVTWDFGDGSPTSTTPNPNHTYTNAGTYIVTLTAMFPNQCTTSITDTIVITNCTPAAFAVNDVCMGTPSTITYSGVVSPTATYTWDFNGGNVISGNGAGPYQVSWNAAGAYNINLIVTEATCSSSVSMPVNVFAIPVSSVTPLSPMCSGATSNVNFNGTAGGTATYTWSFGTATVLSGSGSGPYNLQWNVSGNDSISLIVNDNGCIDSSQIYIQINPIPTSDFNVPAAACSGQSIVVNYTGTATAAANYAWDFDSATVNAGSGQGPYSISWLNGGNYTLNLTVTENGCTSAPYSMPVTVTAISAAAVINNIVLCAGDSNTVSISGTAGVNAIYNWNFTNATVISGAGAGPYTLQWNTPGQDTVYLTVTDNNCSLSSSTFVLINPIPTSDFVINNAACANDPVNLNYTGTATPAANYNWTFSGGTVASGTGGGPYSVIWNTAGAYQVSLVVTENGCVSPPTDLQANVNPLPVVSAGADQVVCSGSPAPIGDLPVAGEIYSWSPTTYLSDPAISNPVATPVNNTVATQQNNYILSVTDANGCINTDTVMVSAFPVPVISFAPPASQCLKKNNFVLAASSNLEGGINYNWTLTPEATPSSSTQSSLSVVYSTVGTFPVLLTADYNGCPAVPQMDSITVYEMPVADFLPLIKEGCQPLTVPMSNLSVGNGNTYSWNFGDGATDNTDNPVHVFQHAGLYSVSLEAVNIHGCVSDTLYNEIIDVYGLPIGQFIPNPQVANVLAPIVQFQNYSTNTLYYLWDFGDNDTSTQVSPNHRYPADTATYNITLMLVSPNGCVDTVRGVVRVEDNFSFYVPSAFSPNGDGVNDEFRGYGIAIKNYLMNIYDRWGDLIYTTDNYDKPWDGRMKSGVIQNDVYVYRIALTDQHNEQHVYVGDVSVVK